MSYELFCLPDDSTKLQPREGAMSGLDDDDGTWWRIVENCRCLI